MKKFLYSLILITFFSIIAFGQDTNIVVPFSNISPLLSHFRLNLPDSNNIEYIDLDNDGDPDILKAVVLGGIPVLWIDDDDDMKQGDVEGDMDSDCLLVDRNKDGKYAESNDIIIDWNDEDGDNIADLQIIADNSEITDKGRWIGHYMCTIDNDKDEIFNFIDWEKYVLEPWEHERRCKFYQDYHGNSVLLKAHTSTFNIEDLRYSWENPFLFYDPDNDGETEMAIRLVDKPEIEMISPDSIKKNPDAIHAKTFKYQHKVNYAGITIDLDNDNDQDNELDYDMSILFSGEGYNYEDQVNKFKSLKGLAGTDSFFYDPRWRQIDELIYTKPENAYNLIFNRGKWNKCWLVFDEDDDCQRWERVEFYFPMDPFKIGPFNYGLDHHAQADATGDRGEWDRDNSGKGKLYVGAFDGRLHLYGAEWGAWRIDQHTRYYQGWQGWRGRNIQPEDLVNDEPVSYITIRYLDTDNNGFLNKIEYDLDGNKHFEYVADIKELGIDDESELIDISNYTYSDFNKLHTQVAENIWGNAQNCVKVADKFNLNINWYANMLNPKTIREKYHYGYWLNFYLFMDFIQYAGLKQDKELLDEITKAYFSSNWNIILK